jgi:hypothetical protein
LIYFSASKISFVWPLLFSFIILLWILWTEFGQSLIALYRIRINYGFHLFYYCCYRINAMKRYGLILLNQFVFTNAMFIGKITNSDSQFSYWAYIIPFIAQFWWKSITFIIFPKKGLKLFAILSIGIDYFWWIYLITLIKSLSNYEAFIYVLSSSCDIVYINSDISSSLTLLCSIFS